MNSIKNFLQRNVVIVTVLPGLAALHWGWLRIQENDVFVKEHERRTEFPLVTGFKIVKGMIFGDGENNKADKK